MPTLVDEVAAVTVMQHLHSSPDEMSSRARVYLLAGTGRHAAIGAFCIIGRDQFAAAAFIPIINFVDLRWWGAAMIFTAALLLGGALFRNRTMARIGLIASAAVTSLLASGLWLGAIGVWLTGGKATPITAIILTTLVIKDLAVCTDPMKTPLELSILWRRAANRGAA